MSPIGELLLLDDFFHILDVLLGPSHIGLHSLHHRCELLSLLLLPGLELLYV